MDYAPGCICGRDKDGSWSEHMPSAQQNCFLTRECPGGTLSPPISFSTLAADAWWELAFFCGHPMGDKQNPLEHLGRVGSPRL